MGSFTKLDDLLKERVPLAQLPTPIQKLERLSEELGIALFVKRDDLTESVASGNKIRKLEYLVRDALARGATPSLPAAGFNRTTAGPRPPSRFGWGFGATSSSGG